jgi:PAS domain S-box-containing protein
MSLNSQADRHSVGSSVLNRRSPEDVGCQSGNSFRRYSLCLITVALALALRLLLDRWLGDQDPYITFILAVAVTGLFAGVGPAIAAALLGAVLAYFSFVPPRYRWGFAGITDAVGFFVYLAAAVAVLVLAKAKNRLTERLSASVAQIQESESRFRMLADNMAQLAWMSDQHGQRFWCNRRWLDYTGSTLEEMNGSGWLKVHHPEHADRVLARIQHSWETGEPWEDSFPLRGKDGTYRWFLARALPVRNDHGKIIRWFGTNTDVTERMNAQKALRRSEALAATGKLAATVAHALNNPLAIAVNLAFLLQHETNDESRRKYLDRMELELQRASVLANRTLSFYHTDAPNAPIFMHDLLMEVISIFQPDCVERDIKLIPQIENVPAVSGSKDELRQVVVNLLSNAIDSIGRDGVIRARIKMVRNAKALQPRIRLTVLDTGCGIERQNIKDIFEPFFSTKGSVGIGLWITRDVVVKHGGTIRFRSHAGINDHGTLVSVDLPAVSDQALTQPEASSRQCS